MNDTLSENIKVHNYYYMLSYAYHVLNEKEFQDIETEKFDHIEDLFSKILIRGLTTQIKSGLFREYRTKTEAISVLRGKIDLVSTLRTEVQIHKKLVCSYDDFSEDTLMNRILKSTAIYLKNSSKVKLENRLLLGKLIIYFDKVHCMDLRHIRWNTFHFHRNNVTYRMLIGICRLILSGKLLTENRGTFRFREYHDDSEMSRLYEKFVLNYFRKHYPQFHAEASHIPWNLDNDQKTGLPEMHTDITLKYREKTLIIDTKWYSKSMRYDSRWNSYRCHSANLYQIYAYVKNYDKEGSRNVSGLLLYAKTDEKITPDYDYSMGGNQISAKTLDLSGEWTAIEKQLKRIADFLILK